MHHFKRTWFLAKTLLVFIRATYDESDPPRVALRIRAFFFQYSSRGTREQFKIVNHNFVLAKSPIGFFDTFSTLMIWHEEYCLSRPRSGTTWTIAECPRTLNPS